MTKGKLRTQMKDWKHAEHFFTGKFCLSFLPEPCGFLEYAANQPNLSHGLHIRLPYLQRIVLQDERLGLQKLFASMFKPNPEPMLLAGTITPHITKLISDCECTQQVIDNHDSLGDELLSAVLDEIACRYCVDESKLVLNAQDLRKLHVVKDILEQETDAPHTLKALAQRTGLNEYKLKKGFKTITQQTVGQYLLSLRMCEAAHLIRESNLPIIEVAGRVGCNNHGHFSVAFKKYFGQSPSLCRAQHR